MGRKLRVAYIDQAGDIGGGAEEALLDILRYMDRERIEPVLLHAERAEWLRDVEMAELRIDVAPWEESDTEDYLRHSLARAGRENPVFDEPAVRRLHELTHGIPRRVSQLANLALLAGAKVDDLVARLTAAANEERRGQ